MKEHTRKAYLAPTLTDRGTLVRQTLQHPFEIEAEKMNPELDEWAVNA